MQTKLTAVTGPVERGVRPLVDERGKGGALGVHWLGGRPYMLTRAEADAPICPWCDRQGWNTCQHADDARTCGK